MKYILPLLIAFFNIDALSAILDADINLECDVVFKSTTETKDTKAFVKIDSAGSDYSSEGGYTTYTWKDNPGAFNLGEVNFPDAKTYGGGANPCFVYEEDISCNSNQSSSDDSIKISVNIKINRVSGYIHYDETFQAKFASDSMYESITAKGFCKKVTGKKF